MRTVRSFTVYCTVRIYFAKNNPHSTYNYPRKHAATRSLNRESGENRPGHPRTWYDASARADTHIRSEAPLPVKVHRASMNDSSPKHAARGAGLRAPCSSLYSLDSVDNTKRLALHSLQISVLYRTTRIRRGAARGRSGMCNTRDTGFET